MAGGSVLASGLLVRQGVQIMKNEHEFEEVIEALKRVHNRFPQLRVGQMICNALPLELNNDPYYLSDSALAKNLNGFVGDGK